jgi:hypothetical protein
MITPESFKDIISAHKTGLKDESRAWDRFRAMYSCSQMKKSDMGDPIDTGNDQDVVFESGALFAYTDSMVSSVVPPNPQVTANPYNEGHRMPSKAREALINTTFHRIRAHTTLWSAATMSAIYPRSFVKAVWKHPMSRPDYINIDPRHIFFDKEAGKWEDIRYLIEATVLTRAEFESRVGSLNPDMPTDPRRVYDPVAAKAAKFENFPMWLRKDTMQTTRNDKELDVFKWVVVYEVYDFTEPVPRYYHFLEAEKEPLYAGPPPYMFLRNPYWMTKFNENLEDNGGLSDAAIIESPVTRLDETRTLELRHAQSTIPVMTLNSAAVDDVEAAKDKLKECTSPGDVLDIELKNGVSIRDAIGQTPTSQLSPSFSAAKQGLEQEILFRLGMPQYTRGVAGSSDVATELALIDSALRTRQGRRIKIMSDLVLFMAKAAIALYEEFLAPDTLLFVRIMDGTPDQLDRGKLKFRTKEEGHTILSTGQFPEDSLTIDYEVVPYSPSENSKTAQLKKLAEFLPILQGAPQFVSQKKLYARITDILELGDLSPSPEELQALAGPPPGPPGAGGPPGAPPGAPNAGNIGTGTDEALSGGDIPASIEPPTNNVDPSVVGGGAGAKLPNSLRAGK